MRSVSVNGVAIPPAAIAAEAAHHVDAADPEVDACRALVVRELLRQRTEELGLTPAAVDQDAEDAAIERLLGREVAVPEPAEEECRRFYERHRQRFIVGALVEASHILFAVPPGAPVQAIRARAAEALHELSARPERFAELAKTLSNCPSGMLGGNLGQLQRGQSVREFEAALFASDRLGLLPELVSTRFGFHILRVDRRLPGRPMPFEQARERVAEFLRERVRTAAIRQYLQVLAGRAAIEGVELPAAESPLVQ
jgi:peptidyl-prolyl cis-trans isomerase C